MPRFLQAIAGVLAGYAAGAAIGALLVFLLSHNTHDKSLEAVMTAAFVTGPIGAIAGLVAALLRKRSPRS